jgi:hypothetical protein
MQRNLRFLMLALVVAATLASAPAALAKGRPMRGTYERTSCFNFTVSASWWKKLDAHAVSVDLYTSNDSWLGAYAWADTAGLPSSFTRSFEGNSASPTMYATISVFAGSDTYNLGTPLASFTTPPASFDCGL